MSDFKFFRKNLFGLKDQDRFRFPPGLIPAWFREAAVLVLFYEESGTVRVVLTQRSATVKDHTGEVCFPGGRLEDGETPLQAALREAAEEVGIDPGRVRIAGRLDDGWSKAGFHMIPFVGWYEGVPTLVPNPDEVGEILVPDVQHLYSAKNREEKTVDHKGFSTTIKIIHYNGFQIFGQTSDILLEAIEAGLGIERSRGKKRAETLGKALRSRFLDEPKLKSG